LDSVVTISPEITLSFFDLFPQLILLKSIQISIQAVGKKPNSTKDLVDIDRLLWGKFESLAVCLAN
jgi:hypothetical protein